MPRHTHPRVHHGKKRRDQAGRSHSHRKQPAPERGYAGQQLARLAGRLAVLNVERDIAPPTILGRKFIPPEPEALEPVRYERITKPKRLTPQVDLGFRTTCNRHPNGRSDEPCHHCKKIRARSIDAGVCFRHPQGDTGEPCGICFAIKQRARSTQTKES